MNRLTFGDPRRYQLSCDMSRTFHVLAGNLLDDLDPTAEKKNIPLIRDIEKREST